MNAAQAERLRRLLARTWAGNPFYRRKYETAGIDIDAMQFPADFEKLPLTTKTELAADQAANPPWGTAMSEPFERYTRYCQTSSTSGFPIRWFDTNESWQWLVDCWKDVYEAAHIGPHDRIFFPFSFGPFLGFWLGFEAAYQIGALAVPGGGMSTELRLAMIEKIGATVICATPTYALHLAEAAGKQLSESTVRIVITGGEPGGSIPATRERIEESWGARVIDHHGMSETGPISFECWESPGALHINEDKFICEVVDSELIVTNLGRVSSPVIRYRTGDIVSSQSGLCKCGRTTMRIDGGILSRADDMINIRGVNVYPSAIESIVRRFPEIVEFRSTAAKKGAMWELSIEVEPAPDAADLAPVVSKLSRQLTEAFSLTVPVRIVSAGSLPRFELKAKRFVVEYKNDN